MKCLRQRKAFTVVEMVIVIAVIAILATVLVPTIAGVIQMANKSADQQFAASLNVQLALWQVDNGEIASESDLRDAINEYYGEWVDEEHTELTADGDFYATLTPKSGKQGFHYWWNATDKQVVLASYEELAKEDDGTDAQAEADEPTFSPASPRSLMIETDEGWKNYFLMDQGGSDVADTLNALEELPGPTEYKNIIDKLQALEEDADDIEILTAVAEKVKTITIVTDGGAFRYGNADYTVDDIDYIWVSPDATLLKQTKVYVYNGTDVDDGRHSDDLAADVMDIYLPSGVSVGLGGLKAPVTESDPQNVYESTTRLHVDTTEVTELLKVYTDCVLVMSNGSKYVWVGDQLFPLPLQFDEDGNLTGSLGGVDKETMGSIGEFGITCNDVAVNPGEGKAYLLDGTVYVAYDKGSVQLSLTGGVTNGMVEWSSDNNTLATVDGTGNVTINTLPGTAEGADYDAKITATYKYDDSKAAEILIYVVQPNVVSFKLGEKQATLINNNSATIAIDYTGENGTQNIVIDTNAIGHNSTTKFVELEAGYFEYDTTGALFSVVNDQLIIEPTAINGESSQTLTITYKGSTANAEYLKATYTVTIKDISATPFEKNKVNGVEMGSEYLFRVGNDNDTTFTLDTLFGCTRPAATAVLKIYDASKYSEGTDVPISVGDSTTAFTVSVTGGTAITDDNDTVIGWTLVGTNDAWKSTALDFDGTGVAVIEIDGVRLAVEVVDGQNVTDGTKLSGSKNNVLLGNISRTSTFTLNADYTIWGNGFTIDTTGCPISNNANIVLNSRSTLDNARVIGKVYETFSDTYNTDYYTATIRMEAESVLSNSYVSNCSVPVRVIGSATIINSTLDGGRYANIDIRGGTLILENVTTINQVKDNVVGLGIVVHYDAQNAAVVINGTLTQHNFIASSDPLPSDTRIDVAKKLMFSNSSFEDMRFIYDGKTYVNAGIIFMDGTQNITWSGMLASGYKCIAEYVSGIGRTVYVYSYDNSKYSFTADSLTYDSWAPNAQNTVKPSFSYTGMGNSKENEREYQYYDSTYTYEDGKIKYYGTIKLGSTTGSVTIEDVLSGVNVSKYSGQTIAVNFATTGEKGTGNAVTFTEDGTITYTVTDTRFFDKDGDKIDGGSTSYTFTIKVEIEKTSLPKAVIKATGGNVYWLSDGSFIDPNYYACIPVLDGVTIEDEDGKVIWSGNGETDPGELTITVTFIQGAGTNMDKYQNYTVGSTLYYQTQGVADAFHGGYTSKFKENTTQTIYEVTYNYKSDEYSAAESVTVRFTSTGGSSWGSPTETPEDLS